MQKWNVVCLLDGGILMNGEYNKYSHLSYVQETCSKIPHWMFEVVAESEVAAYIREKYKRTWEFGVIRGYLSLMECVLCTKHFKNIFT